MSVTLTVGEVETQVVGVRCVVEGCRDEPITAHVHGDFGGRVAIITARCPSHPEGWDNA